MPRIRALFLAAALAGATPALPQTAPDDPVHACQPGARLPYPLDAAIRNRVILLSLTTQRDMIGDPDNLPQPVTPEILKSAREWQRQDAAEKAKTLDDLAAMPAVERDMTLLAALDRVTAGDRPVARLVTQIDDRFLPLYLEAMDRNGLTPLAEATRAGLALFGPGATDARTRDNLWIAPVTFTMNEPLDLALQKHDAEFLPQRPALMRMAERLARQDPQLSAALTAEAGKVDEMIYLDWIAEQIFRCAVTNLQDRDGDIFAALPPPQHDVLILDLFMDEVMNGGTHQFFVNSSGNLSPEVHDILLRRDLPEHAAELKAAMDLLGVPYPRDRTHRHRVMDQLDAAGHEALNAPTGIMDDGAVFGVMLNIARRSGLMVE